MASRSLFETTPVVATASTTAVAAAPGSAREKYQMTLASLSESDKRQLEAAKKGLQPGNVTSIQEYGKSTINMTNGVVDQVLKTASSTSLDDIGGNINDILLTAKKIDAGELVAASKRSGNPLVRLLPWFFETKEKVVARFNSLGEQIGKTADEIKKALDSSTATIKTLEDMSSNCVQQYQQMDVLIIAARAQAEELREQYTISKEALARDPNADAIQLQQLNEDENFIDSLEKKISNMEQMQQVIYLNIPQLAMMRKNAIDTRSEFQQIIDMTIPLWKNQFTQALLQDQQTRSSELIKSTKDFTNNMLMKSADELKATSLRIAEQQARGLIDRKSLEHVQKQLIDTVNGTLEIHRKAKEERLQVSQSIQQLRLDFKNSLQGT